jgi:hypothetical protein
MRTPAAPKVVAARCLISQISTRAIRPEVCAIQAWAARLPPQEKRLGSFAGSLLIWPGCTNMFTPRFGNDRDFIARGPSKLRSHGAGFGSS